MALMRLRGLLLWAPPGIALPMLALTLIPGQVWSASTVDQVYRGFDRSLITRSGSVQVAPGVAEFKASPDSAATANLATTLRRTLDASVDATVVVNDGAAQPLRVGVWSPWTGTGYFVAFGPSPDNLITTDTVSGGDAGATLIGGEAVSATVGRYELRTTYRIAFLVDRAAGLITATVAGPGVNVRSSLLKTDSPALFGNVQLSLSVSAMAGSGVSQVTLRNYVLTLPHERVWTATTKEQLVKALSIVLAFLGILTLLAGAILYGRRPRFLLRTRLFRTPSMWLAIGTVVLYIGGNAMLFRVGGHPFDFSNEQLYAYVAKAYGPTHLYFLPDVTSLAGSGDGVPWIQASFPYEPVMAYLFTSIGWLSNVLFGGIGLSGSGATQLGYVIKAVNVAFGLADGVLLYFILHELHVGERWSRIGAAFFLFNPAVWFSMSVWGQTHVFSIFFVLSSILFAQKRMPLWAWLSLAAACLTRPQMLVFGLLLGAAFLTKFTWRENGTALALTMIVTFVALVPLTLSTSPSLPVDIMLYNVRVQEAGGNQASLTTVSQSAYSVWPLVTYLFHGASGVYRAFTPSSNSLIGSITYQGASQILTLLGMLIVTAALVVRKRLAADPESYLPLVAVGVTSFLMLLTGIVATHFLLALPLLLLCRRSMDSIAYCSVAAIWTITTLVPMFGDMGNVISSYSYPLLAPAFNPVTRFFVELYGWDRFITVAIVANVCAVIWVAILAYRPAFRSHVDAAGESS